MVLEKEISAVEDTRWAINRIVIVQKEKKGWPVG